MSFELLTLVNIKLSMHRSMNGRVLVNGYTPKTGREDRRSSVQGP